MLRVYTPTCEGNPYRASHVKTPDLNRDLAGLEKQKEGSIMIRLVVTLPSRILGRQGLRRNIRMVHQNVDDAYLGVCNLKEHVKLRKCKHGSLVRSKKTAALRFCEADKTADLPKGAESGALFCQVPKRTRPLQTSSPHQAQPGQRPKSIRIKARAPLPPILMDTLMHQ